MSTRIRVALLGCGLATVMAAAQAVPVNIANGAYAATFVRDCRSAAAQAAGSQVPDRCNDSPNATVNSFAGTMVEQLADLRPGQYTAGITALNPLGITALGNTQSSVNAAGVAGTLVLHQGAFTSLPYARVSGHSDAMQSFFYNGSGPRTRTIQTTLSYNADPLMGGVDWQNTITGPAALGRAAVRVFSLNVGYFGFDWTRPSTDFTDVFGSGGFANVAALAAASYREEGLLDTQVTGAGPLVNTLTFSLQPGRFYFVESYLGLWAKFGGHFDATHTFVAQLGVLDPDGSFVPSLEGLAPAAEGVLPEPPVAALAALALAGLAAARRRPQLSGVATSARPARRSTRV